MKLVRWKLSPLLERVGSFVKLTDMADTFEFVLHFVRCGTVTVSPNQIIIFYINKVVCMNLTLIAI